MSGKTSFSDRVHYFIDFWNSFSALNHPFAHRNEGFMQNLSLIGSKLNLRRPLWSHVTSIFQPKQPKFCMKLSFQYAKEWLSAGNEIRKKKISDHPNVHTPSYNGLCGMLRRYCSYCAHQNLKSNIANESYWNDNLLYQTNFFAGFRYHYDFGNLLQILWETAWRKACSTFSFFSHLLLLTALGVCAVHDSEFFHQLTLLSASVKVFQKS